MMKICFSYLEKIGGETGTLGATGRNGGLVPLVEVYVGARGSFYALMYFIKRQSFCLSLSLDFTCPLA